MYYCGDLDEGIYLSVYFIFKKIKKNESFMFYVYFKQAHLLLDTKIYNSF